MAVPVGLHYFDFNKFDLWLLMATKAYHQLNHKFAFLIHMHLCV